MRKKSAFYENKIIFFYLKSSNFTCNFFKNNVIYYKYGCTKKSKADLARNKIYVIFKKVLKAKWDRKKKKKETGLFLVTFGLIFMIMFL